MCLCPCACFLWVQERGHRISHCHRRATAPDSSTSVVYAPCRDRCGRRCASFGVVFVELAVLTSLWLDQYYYVFGFLLVVFFILAVTCAEITIVLTYFQLCGEDYEWWRSFCTSGACAVYVFLYRVLLRPSCPSPSLPGQPFTLATPSWRAYASSLPAEVSDSLHALVRGKDIRCRQSRLKGGRRGRKESENSLIQDSERNKVFLMLGQLVCYPPVTKYTPLLLLESFIHCLTRGRFARSRLPS